MSLMFAILLAAALSLQSFETVNANAKNVTYRGREAIQLVPTKQGADTHMLAILKDSALVDGSKSTSPDCRAPMRRPMRAASSASPFTSRGTIAMS